MGRVVEAAPTAAAAAQELQEEAALPVTEAEDSAASLAARTWCAEGGLEVDG